MRVAKLFYINDIDWQSAGYPNPDKLRFPSNVKRIAWWYDPMEQRTIFKLECDAEALLPPGFSLMGKPLELENNEGVIDVEFTVVQQQIEKS